MTREEEIKKAIDIQFPKGLGERTNEQALAAAGFELGVKWADEHPKNIWHDTNEEPQQDRLMLGIDCEGASIYKWIGQDPNGWYSFIKETCLSKWAYIDDLLPKGGKK